MRHFSLVIIGLILISASCKEEEQLPSCIESLIAEIKTQDVWNPPAKLYQYNYNGETVYYVPQRCCDIPSALYSESCEVICSPDGGFTGRGDGKCNDFFESRAEELLVWEDERSL